MKGGGGSSCRTHLYIAASHGYENSYSSGRTSKCTSYSARVSGSKPSRLPKRRPAIFFILVLGLVPLVDGPQENDDDGVRAMSQDVSLEIEAGHVAFCMGAVPVDGTQTAVGHTTWPP